MSNHVLSLWLVTSTTSVSPSQRPRESPIQNSIPSGGWRAVGVNQPEHLRPLEGDGHGVARLEDLERVVDVHDPRHAGQVAVGQRIGGGAVGEVLGLLGGRPRLIGNAAAVHDAAARRAP